MNYLRREIVWVKFPFTDSSTFKLRPALILSNSIINKTGDYILMQITTKLRNDNLSLQLKNQDFEGTPLLKSGELRLHKVFVLNKDLIEGRVAKVSEDFMKRVIDSFFNLLQ